MFLSEKQKQVLRNRTTTVKHKLGKQLENKGLAEVTDAFYSEDGSGRFAEISFTPLGERAIDQLSDPYHNWR